jgi:hypothetical protein
VDGQQSETGRSARSALATKINTLTLAEWCDYWQEGNGQYNSDGVIVGDVRSELAAASFVIRKLLQGLDEAILNGAAWIKQRDAEREAAERLRADVTHAYRCAAEWMHVCNEANKQLRDWLSDRS